LADYVHPELGQQIRAIGGGYTTVKERLISENGQQVLYAVLVGIIDASCCGEGGCVYATVPGFVVEYQTKRGPDGQPVSIVEPVRDKAVRQRVAQAIQATEKVQEVRFWPL